MFPDRYIEHGEVGGSSVVLFHAQPVVTGFIIKNRLWFVNRFHGKTVEKDKKIHTKCEKNVKVHKKSKKKVVYREKRCYNETAKIKIVGGTIENGRFNTVSVQNDGMMWALVKEKPEVGLWMKRVPIPEVGPNDVKIKIHKTAICGTDVHIYQWNDWAQHTIPVGLTAGHEYVGEVVEVGPGVKGFKIGDLVSGEGHITCGKCRNCLEGHKENCKDAKGVGVNRNGAFAEYLVIPASNVWPCNPNIPEEMYAIFDPFGNATHTALSYDMLGEDVLVAGAGPIGIMAAAIAKFAGARHVVVTDMNQYRLDLAKKLGATRTVNLKEEKLSDVLKEIGMTEGFDVGLEMSGSQAGLHDMIHNMKHGGNIALLGLQRTDATVDLETVIFNGLNIRGIYGRKVWDTWYKMSTMLQAGLDISEIITHRFDIKDYEKGFEAMISGQSGKVVLDWAHVND